MNGYIEFSVSGGNEARSRFGAATMDATKNENAVVVTKAQAVQFLALRDVIEEAIAGGPPATSYIAPSTRTSAPPTPPPPSVPAGWYPIRRTPEYSVIGMAQGGQNTLHHSLDHAEWWLRRRLFVVTTPIKELIRSTLAVVLAKTTRPASSLRRVTGHGRL